MYHSVKYYAIFTFVNPITDYINYRKYILDFYNWKKSSGKFTWREFAKLSGFGSPVYLKLLTEGKSGLSDDAVERVASAMNLVGFEQQYFKLLVEYDRAQGDTQKMGVMKRIRSLARRHKVNVLSAGEFAYFEHIENPVIRELAPAMKRAKASELAEACVPQITAGAAEDALRYLLQAGFLKKDARGHYHRTKKSVGSGKNAAMPFILRNMQKQMCDLAKDAVENVAPEERDISGLTLGVTADAFERIRKELAECRRRIVAIATESDRTEQVYRLNLQLFPLSRNLKSLKQEKSK